MSPHLARASLPPCVGLSSCFMVTRVHLRFPILQVTVTPLRPLAPAQSHHARPRLAQTLSHLLPRSAGTLRTRPAPGRPAALAAPAPARVPAARPPLTACFREPCRPPAAAMMVLSRDGGAAIKPRPSPPSGGTPDSSACGLLEWGKVCCSRSGRGRCRAVAPTFVTRDTCGATPKLRPIFSLFLRALG